MYLLLATLFYLGTTPMVDNYADHVLPEVARWGWMTILMYSCCLASVYAPWARWYQQAVGYLCIFMFLAGYVLYWDTLLALVPTDPAWDHWPLMFLLLNVAVPAAVILLGPMRTAIRTGEG